MNKKKIFVIILFIIVIFLAILIGKSINKKENATQKLTATVLSVENDKIIVLDYNSNIYEFPVFGDDINAGDILVIEYTGLIESSRVFQNADIINYQRTTQEVDENGIPVSWKDDGIFSDYYVMAFNKLKTLSLDEKIGQLLLVRYPENNVSNILNQYKLGGFVFFERDFRDKSESEVQNMIKNAQEISKIPLLTAVDEEGGNVVRISSNPLLVSERFKSPQELYALGGMNEIKNDTINKSKVLKKLGLNVNLAPVVDVSTDTNDYIYPRTIGENTLITSNYAKTVIEASKGTFVSYTLKHFPGYGNNSNTHLGSSVDNRAYDDIINNDIPPFQAGIDAGAEAVLVSHNIVNSIDPDNPASLSPAVHNLLRGNLQFTGVIITDNISMSALNDIDDINIMALLSGNNIIITDDYQTSFNEIKTAILDDIIDESIIDQSVFKILAWKYYKGLMSLK